MYVFVYEFISVCMCEFMCVGLFMCMSLLVCFCVCECVHVSLYLCGFV